MELSAPHSRARRPAPMRHRQRGDIMLVTLVFVLMCLLGLVYSMRDGIVSTLMTGNNLTRQKDVQVADIALRAVEGQILTVYNGQPLEIAATGQNWWRVVAAGTAGPSGSYWDTCNGGSASSSTRCGAITLTMNNIALPYTAYAVVQPTGRSDTNSCTVSQLTAIYYDVFVHVKESNGATVANTETIYKLCALT